MKKTSPCMERGSFLQKIRKGKEKMAQRLPILYNKKPCYDIVFAQSFEGLWEELSLLGCAEKRLCIVTDSKVDELYGDEVRNLLEGRCLKTAKFVFPQGEENKTLDTVRTLYRFLIEEGFDRKDMLLALGGGVVGDLAGYAAATYLRGIDFVQIPTTLLSQCDSSIGGKTGVDFDGYKNMVGAFKMPKLVYMNLSVLQTLDDRQFFSGFAEVMKHGLIRDAVFYEWLIDKMYEICERDLDTLEEMVMRSCAVKKLVVEKERYSQLPAIFRHFTDQMKKLQKIGVAYVTTAFELTKTQKEQVEKRLLETTGYVKLELYYDIDPLLIGGMVIRIDDRVVDSSVRTKLDHLTKQLLNIQLG